MTDNTKTWLHGLGAAFISAFSTSVTGMFALPSVFNFTRDGLINMVKVSLPPAAFAVFAYLKASPLPPLAQKVTEATEKQVELTDGILKSSEVKTTTTEPLK